MLLKDWVEVDVTLKHPFTALVAGPTGCGKSTFVKKLIKYKDIMMDPTPSRIVWHYGEYQHMFDELQSLVEFKEGLPDIEHFEGSEPTLLVLDDLMQETDESVSKLFTKGSHHRNLSILLLVQNVFDKNKHLRTISLNTHYLVFFKNPRDASQFTHLAKQMRPGHVHHMQEAFTDATTRPYGYLFIDFTQETTEDVRLRTDIFPDEATQMVYINKGKQYDK